MNGGLEVDLRGLLGPLLEELRSALNSFVEENPDREVCTVGLQGDGFHGTISLCLDTPEHRQAHVAKWGPKGWVGADEHGQFCDNCPDFAYWLIDHQLPGFPDFYEVDEDTTVLVRGLDGSFRSTGLDDDALHAAIAEPLMRAVVRALIPFDVLLQAEPFRVLLQFIARDALDVMTSFSATPEQPSGGASSNR